MSASRPSALHHRRGGQVLSAALAGSVVCPALDAKTVAVVRYASLVSAPPHGMGETISLPLSVHFSR